MKLLVQRSSDLPPMAWLMRLDLGDAPVLNLLAGGDVETFDNGWAEGAWSGEFQYFDILNSYLAGTGGKVDGEQLVLVPPFHSARSLFVARKSDTVFASNSLAFLIAGADLQLYRSKNGPFYPVLLDELSHGIEAYNIRLPTTDGPDIYVMSLRPVAIGLADGEMSWLDPYSAADFTDFRSYADFLKEISTAVCANANDPNRRAKYRPLSLLSKGYDSTAATVLAREAGAKRVLTIMKSQGAFDESFLDDSGIETGRYLGMEVKEFPREVKVMREGRPVVDELWATGFPTGDLVYLTMEEEFRRSVVFSGQHGDEVWTKGIRLANRFQRIDLMGNSLSELFLRTSTIFFPVPFLGSECQEDIESISRSPEMAKWRIGGDYDRPVPRRLVEEYGVPRDYFGVKKAAAGARGLPAAMRDKDLKSALGSEYTSLMQDAQSESILAAIKGTARGHLRNVYKKLLPPPLLSRVRGVVRHGFRRPPEYIVLDPPVIGRQSDYIKSVRNAYFLWGVDRLAQTRYSPSAAAWRADGSNQTTDLLVTASED